VAISTSLSTRIILLVMCISVVSIIALASISINISHQALKKDAAQRLNVIASDRMQMLDSIWDLQMDQVDALAAEPDILSLLTMRQEERSNSLLDAQEMELSREIRENVFQKFLSLTNGKYTSTAAVLLLDSGGELVAGSQDNPSVNYGNTQFALEIMKNYQHDRMDLGRLSNSFYHIAYSSNHGAAVLVMVAPVFDSESIVKESSLRAPTGYVIVLKDIESASGILGDKRFMGETGESYLVDSNGLMLTSSRFYEGARYQQIVSSVPVEACFENGADINAAQYISYTGNLVFGTSQCAKNVGIVLLSEQANSELFAPMVSLQERYLSIILGIIGAAALVSFHLSISILRPLQKLRDIMKNVQDGTFQKADIIRGDEIGDLSKSFNSMVDELEIRAKKLKERNHTLEVLTARLDAYAQALFKADKEKEAFSTMIADELKRFVIPIIGFCELILDGSLGEIGKRPKEKIEIMLERAWALQNLVQNIIDVRRLESGMLKMNTEPGIAVNWLMQKCLDNVRTILHSEGITISVEVDDRLKLECDPIRIVQMLQNLVEFSIRRTLEANKTMISMKASLSSDAMEKETSVVFSIEDDGNRISEQEKKDIIENKFYNLDTSFTRTAGGTDVGIIIARSIVEAHKGKIAIRSDQGNSTAFIISIPVSQKLSVSAAPV
jgi:signal transduction histidine kinase